MRERAYQAKLVKRIKKDFPGCVVIRNDPRERQGIPDLLILFRDRWAMLEVKMSSTSDVEPNQTYYVETFGQMSYCSFICPEFEERVFNELQFALNDRR